MMSRLFAFAVATVLLTCWSTETYGQAFFGGGGQSFDPEISVVESGALLDVQATVSHDRKYVTLTARPQVASLIALREFVFQNGFNPAMNPGRVPSQEANKPQKNGRMLPALAKPAEPTPVLYQEGMHRVDMPSTTAARQ